LGFQEFVPGLFFLECGHAGKLMPSAVLLTVVARCGEGFVAFYFPRFLLLG